MPIYEYKCRICDEHFEVEQSFTDETLTELDGCLIDESGHHQVKKVFAAPAIAFKGDGFYRNDARSSAASSTTSGSDALSSEKPSDKSSDASSDSATTTDSSAGKSSESSPSSSSNGTKAKTSTTSSSGD